MENKGATLQHIFLFTKATPKRQVLRLLTKEISISTRRPSAVALPSCSCFCCCCCCCCCCYWCCCCCWWWWWWWWWWRRRWWWWLPVVCCLCLLFVVCSCSCSCSCYCSCCFSYSSSSSSSWQHVRLPPRGVCRFPCWHVLKLEFWHFPLPKFILRFLFSSVFAVFLAKKCHKRRAALSKNLLGCPFRICFFRCFPVCVAFRIGICSVVAISRLSAHASFDLHSSFNSLRGFGGGMGGGGDHVHATATGVLVLLC